jgi:hypothetical protein
VLLSVRFCLKMCTLSPVVEDVGANSLNLGWEFYRLCNWCQPRPTLDCGLIAWG